MNLRLWNFSDRDHFALRFKGTGFYFSVRAMKKSRTAVPNARGAKPGHLSLNLFRDFFDQIAMGTKVEEYRANTPFWRNRLQDCEYSEVHFRNGYATRAPFMRVECKGIRKRGKGRGSYFVIRLGKVLQFRNYRLKKR